MESNNELQHWGIKGQKWGVRRYQNPDGSYTEEGIRRYQKKYPYQNPDGSLTEAGKTNYMKAARKNQLDYKNLSDKDLDMINNRFNKENQYKRNIENYEKSTFKYKAKEAIISRIKGNNGGGDGGGKKKGKGGGGKGNGILTKLLLSPIEQAFKDALKSDNNSGGKEEKEENNKKENNDTNEEYAPGLRNLLSSGRHFALTGYSEDSSERLESRRKNGQRFVEEAVNRTSEEVLRERSRNRAIARQNDSWWQNRMDNPDSWGWSGMTFDTSNYLKHSGWAVTRSDELYHFGIKGQKWGIRRYQNPDGTLTEEGRQRYRSESERKNLAGLVEKTVVRKKSIYASDREIDKALKYGSEVRQHPVVMDAAKKVQTELGAYKDAEKEMRQQTDAFYNNEKVYEKYLNKAVNSFMKKYGSEGFTRNQVYDWFKNDDGDEGEGSSIELFKRSPEGKKLVQAEKRSQDAYKVYTDSCKKYISEYLGSYGDKNIAAYGDWKRNITSRLTDFVQQVAEGNITVLHTS